MMGFNNKFDCLCQTLRKLLVPRTLAFGWGFSGPPKKLATLLNGYPSKFGFSKSNRVQWVTYVWVSKIWHTGALPLSGAQNLISLALAQKSSDLRICCKSAHNFVSYLEHKQTHTNTQMNNTENITFTIVKVGDATIRQRGSLIINHR